MAEERTIVYTYDNGVLVNEVKAEISDEQLADEAEAAALARADELIDEIVNIASSRTFLKRLCRRLIRKGVLP